MPSEREVTGRKDRGFFSYAADSSPDSKGRTFSELKAQPELDLPSGSRHQDVPERGPRRAIFEEIINQLRVRLVREVEEFDQQPNFVPLGKPEVLLGAQVKVDRS